MIEKYIFNVIPYGCDFKKGDLEVGGQKYLCVPNMLKEDPKIKKRAINLAKLLLKEGYVEQKSFKIMVIQ